MRNRILCFTSRMFDAAIVIEAASAMLTRNELRAVIQDMLIRFRHTALHLVFACGHRVTARKQSLFLSRSCAADSVRSCCLPNFQEGPIPTKN